jgi:hypothetical protein
MLILPPDMLARRVVVTGQDETLRSSQWMPLMSVEVL